MLQRNFANTLQSHFRQHTSVTLTPNQQHMSKGWNAHQPSQRLAAVSVRIQSPWFLESDCCSLMYHHPALPQHHDTQHSYQHSTTSRWIPTHKGTSQAANMAQQVLHILNPSYSQRQASSISSATIQPTRKTAASSLQHCQSGFTHRMLGVPGPLAGMNLVLLPRCVTWPTGCSHQLSQPWLCHTYACLLAECLISAGEVYTRTKTCSKAGQRGKKRCQLGIKSTQIRPAAAMQAA